MERERDWIEWSVEQKRKARSARYVQANLPPAVWEVTRENLSRVPEGFLEWMDALADRVSSGSGITFLGPRRSRKTFWGSILLRKALSVLTPVEMSDEIADVLRVDYHELVTRTYLREGLHERPFVSLRCGKLIFLDNLYGPPPPPAVMMALHARKDAGKSLILGVLAENMAGLSESRGIADIVDMWSGINRTMELKPE